MKLPRFGRKGQFVKYPKHWRKRMRDNHGRRFQTSCDMVVGKCACGLTHEQGLWDNELHHYEDTVETLAEWGTRCDQQ